MARPNSGALGEHIQGLREAKAAFQALPEIVRTRLLVATEKTLQEIVRHAQMRIAASPSIRTRALFNSIAYTLNKKSGRGKAGVANVTTTTTMMRKGRKINVKGIVIAGRGGSALKSQGARVVRPARYAHLVERGTRHMKAEPFMIPSAESQKDAYLRRCVEERPRIEQDVAAIGHRLV